MRVRRPHDEQGPQAWREAHGTEEAPERRPCCASTTGRRLLRLGRTGARLRARAGPRAVAYVDELHVAGVVLLGVEGRDVLEVVGQRHLLGRRALGSLGRLVGRLVALDLLLGLLVLGVARHLDHLLGRCDGQDCTFIHHSDHCYGWIRFVCQSVSGSLSGGLPDL